MLLTYKNEITILYSGECRNTYFKIKRSIENKQEKTIIFYNEIIFMCSTE